MDILTFSSLYPNLVQPIHGIFVETRLRHLMAYGGVTSRVVAPRPWFFSGRPFFGSYAKYAQIPRQEIRQGVIVEHPAYLVLPKISMTAQPFSMYMAARSIVKRILASGFDFKLIDAHYGCHAALSYGRHAAPPPLSRCPEASKTGLSGWALPGIKLESCAMAWICGCSGREIVRRHARASILPE